MEFTQAEQDAVRATVKANDAKLMRELAPLYLGKSCVFPGRGECLGPSCMGWLCTGDGNRITGGSCVGLLVASQVGPIADGLMQLALSNRAAPGTDPGLGRVIR